MKKLKYLLLLTLFIPNLSIKAATGMIDIYASNKNVTIGDSTTVTIYCKSSDAVGTCEYSLNYDKNKLKLTSGDVANLDVAPNSTTKQLVKTFKFKAIATGTSTVTVKSYAIRDFKTDEEITTTVDPVTIKVVEAKKEETPSNNNKPTVTYSTNNNLKSLTIEGQTIEPKFDKNTTTYKVSVDESIETIKITAQKEDNKASIKGDGTFNISNGENKFEIVVTSEKGTKKTYTIIVTSEEKNPIKLTYDNEELTVIKRKSLLKKPDNSYEEKTIKINEQDIPALYSKITSLTLIGVKNKDGNIVLYEYNVSDDTIKPHISITSNSLTLVLKEPNKKLSKITVKINDESYEMYQSENSNYPLFYATNIETGENNWYTYDEKENTIQRFEELNNNKKLEESKRIILILAGTTLFFAISFFIALASRPTTPKKRNKKIEQSTNKEKQKKPEKILEDW